MTGEGIRKEGVGVLGKQQGLDLLFAQQSEPYKPVASSPDPSIGYTWGSKANRAGSIRKCMQFCQCLLRVIHDFINF